MKKMNNVHVLDIEQVKAIREFLIIKDDLIRDGSFNKVLRDDIFQLLESQDCIVLYYPLENEENNGFHVEYPYRGELKHFVYINTDQFKETQIFTAAHELGHIWKIIEFMQENGFSGDDEWEERVISRFAAELLMPKDEFRSFAIKEIVVSKKQYTKKQLPMTSIIRIVTAIMNEFFTPFKSVVHRLYELMIISEKLANTLLEKYDTGEYRDYSMIVANEQGYNRLYQTPDKLLKHIDGLKELLDEAKNNNAMPEKWLASMYSLFDYEFDRQDITLGVSLPDDISIIEGGDIDEENGGY